MILIQTKTLETGYYKDGLVRVKNISETTCCSHGNVFLKPKKTFVQKLKELVNK